MLYEPERLAKIAEEAAKVKSVFTLNDRLGLVYDSVALSKAGLAKVSSALTLLDTLGKNEKECKSKWYDYSQTCLTGHQRSHLGRYWRQFECFGLYMVGTRRGCQPIARFASRKYLPHPTGF